jgi:hypothetical protein
MLRTGIAPLTRHATKPLGGRPRNDMNASARKPAQPAAGAKPNAAAEDKRHAERLWELYVKAFEGLLDRHCCVPAEQYQTAGSRMGERASDR